MNTTHESELHQRLSEAVGKTTYRRLGQLTGTHPETVRRYMLGQSPSTEFLASLCRNLAINANWLLTGKGPIRLGDVRKQALNEAQAGDLLTAMANSITSLVERVDRLELFVQGMDTRLRGSGRITPKPSLTNPPPASRDPDLSDERLQTKPRSKRSRTDDHSADRVGRAVTKRSPPDDG